MADIWEIMIRRGVQVGDEAIGVQVGDEAIGTPRARWKVYLSNTLKVLAEACTFAAATAVLVEEVIPGIQTGSISAHDETSKNISAYNATSKNISAYNATSKNISAYNAAAYAYITFYAIVVLATIVYWVTYCLMQHPPFAALLVGLIYEMPLMVCDMSMLKAGGVVEWDGQLYDLMLQTWFVFDVIIHTYLDIVRKWEDIREIGCCCILLQVTILGICFLVACILYAPVVWSIAGWHWFGRIRMGHIKGIVESSDTKNVFEMLMLFGQIGQWVIIFLIVFYPVYCCCRSWKTFRAVSPSSKYV